MNLEETPENNKSEGLEKKPCAGNVWVTEDTIVLERSSSVKVMFVDCRFGFARFMTVCMPILSTRTRDVRVTGTCDTTISEINPATDFHCTMAITAGMSLPRSDDAST